MSDQMTSIDIAAEVRGIAQASRVASRVVARVSAVERIDALHTIAVRIEQDAALILAANATDVHDAKIAQRRGDFAQSLVDRLVLDQAKLSTMIKSIHAVAALPVPTGRVLAKTRLDQGLELTKISVPLGVIAAIFEARPDAVTQIASLALMSGNAVILKGGSEAARTTEALVTSMRAALDESRIPADAIMSVHGRASVDALLKLDDCIDLIIPRGSGALVRAIQSNTRIPVLGHAEGVCHVYIDRDADVEMATEIVVDSKVQYPAACNSVETVLVHAEIASNVLSPIATRLNARGVELRGCATTRSVAQTMGCDNLFVGATDDDWRTEYGALILAFKIVDSVEEAVSHIATYGSRHTESIVTNNAQAAAFFLAEVDAAGVYHNASTRFADGYRYGLGAEVGVSTSKLHARGPVGIDGLTTYKYVLQGDGHLVANYVGPDARPFLHQALDRSDVPE